MVKTVSSNARGEGLIPDQGTKVSHALGSKKKQKAENKKTMKQKQYYKKFNKDLEKMFHVKKFF